MFLPFIGFGQSDIFGEKTGCISGDCVNGYGVYVWYSGNKYEGWWKNDQRHGQGTYTHDDGTVRKGKWINNVFQKPKPSKKAVCNRKSKLAIAD